MKKEGGATFYSRPDRRLALPVPMIRGTATLEQIKQHSRAEEADILDRSFQQMRAALRGNGAISSHGVLLEPSSVPLPNSAVVGAITAAKLRSQFAVDSATLGLRPNELVHLWTPELAHRYTTRHYRHDSVEPAYTDNDGRVCNLTQLVEAFGSHITRPYAQAGIVPSYRPRSLARSFMIEILEHHHAQWLQRHGSRQLPQTQ